MRLKVLLPFQVFLEKQTVSRIVAEMLVGSFGILPHRLDCITPLSPGILTYQIDSEPETYLAVDEGVLVKTGPDVLVSVRRAVAGTDLRELRDLVKKEFVTLNDQDRRVKVAMAKLEIGFLRRFERFQHE